MGKLPPRRSLRTLIVDGLIVAAILFGAITLIERWTDRTPHLNEVRSVSPGAPK